MISVRSFTTFSYKIITKLQFKTSQTNKTPQHAHIEKQLKNKRICVNSNQTSAIHSKRHKPPSVCNVTLTPEGTSTTGRLSISMSTWKCTSVTSVCWHKSQLRAMKPGTLQMSWFAISLPLLLLLPPATPLETGALFRSRSVWRSVCVLCVVKFVCVLCVVKFVCVLCKSEV